MWLAGREEPIKGILLGSTFCVASTVAQYAVSKADCTPGQDIKWRLKTRGTTIFQGRER